ncbi:MAG: transcriptional regulator [Desulfobacterales bacterium CG07_land_8_20_14_0_80_52_14]|nr:MAG: transcriptional regulator [Desulfobacterales bacterium CG23_combo_of_CG06-09_8_20_14_all_52_9]PIU48887.1 MAG: transcriptional regulator [Desulfobacterales bacterium CG07_land_8_20_14_0_80_52_14]
MKKTIYTEDQKRLRNLLKSARLEAGLTQEQLAERLSVPQSFVSKYESGERKLDLIELRNICRALGISLLSFVRQFDESL